ncbi:Hsp20/alpha crystallin family protein [Fulvivirgaceae bacterium LMO-SS25]
MRFADDFKLDMKVLDVQNTLAGGCAAPYIKLQKEDGFWLVYAKIPGLRENRFDVELDKRNLRINYKLEMPNVGDQVDGHIRLMAGYMELPSEVNMQAIEAEFEDGLLKIIMPIDAYLDSNLENPFSDN